MIRGYSTTASASVFQTEDEGSIPFIRSINKLRVSLSYYFINMIANIDDIRLEQFLRNRNSGKLVWKTKEGKIIPLKELSDEHLTNILNVYSRNKDRITNIKPSSLNFY